MFLVEGVLPFPVLRSFAEPHASHPKEYRDIPVDVESVRFPMCDGSLRRHKVGVVLPAALVVGGQLLEVVSGRSDRF